MFSFTINMFLSAKRVEFAMLSSAVVIHRAQCAWTLNGSFSPRSILQIPVYAMINDEQV